MTSGQTPYTIPEQDFEATIFDLDGVVTDSAKVHAAAWKRLFDAYLDHRKANGMEPFAPFDIDTDYRLYVDGKPRLDGARSFLDARGISLPEGSESDAPGFDSVAALGASKDGYFLEAQHASPAEAFPTSLDFIRHLRDRGLETAIVSASRNCKAVLEAAGIEDMFSVRVDGVESERRHLAGKPAPDIFSVAALRLGIPPHRCIVVEDAIAGVQAGRRGHFGLVVGVDRTGHPNALRKAGADIVVSDLSELTLRPVSDKTRKLSSWALVFHDFDPDREGIRESLCALGNGYLVSRGASAESDADSIHYPGTYIAGCYNRLVTEIAGHEIDNEDLVNCPNWLPLTFRPADGDWFNVMAVKVLSFRQDLDLRTGVLYRGIRFKDHKDRVTFVSSRRIVHMHHPHILIDELTIIPENWSGEVQVRSGLDGRVINSGVDRYRALKNKHLSALEAGQFGEDGLFLLSETSQSQIRIGEAARTRVYRDDNLMAVTREAAQEPDYVAHTLTFDVSANHPVTVEKVAAVYTSRDSALSEPGLEARHAVERIGRTSELYESHLHAWSALWNVCAITVDAGVGVQRILRLHVFHLLQTMSHNTVGRDVGVPARGLHGEAYRGHIFWDEVFICPFFSVSVPEITRSILMYRYRRLDEARWAARAAGFRGAMYPWQSGADGREESQAWHLNPRSGRWIADNSHLQRHVNAAVAYNVWKYYQATRDTEFMADFGAEMILEIARFWASVTTWNEDMGRFEIKGVMGPDEYSDGYPDRDVPGIDNNAYTNVMAAWVLCKALQVLELLDEERLRELCGILSLHDEEVAEWDRISKRMRVVFHDDGIISQYEGYGELKELDWQAYARRYGDISRLDRILEAEGDNPNRYKVSKQADVLMLFYLLSPSELEALFDRLGYPFGPDTVAKNTAYYVSRTSHGSSLSRVVHSWVLARMDRERSWLQFKDALEGDIDDDPGGTTAEGIHLGAMAGTVDLMQRCFGGVDLREDVLWLDPHLPAQLSRLSFPVVYRGHRVELDITKDQVRVRTHRSMARPIDVDVRGERHRFLAGDERTFPLDGSAAG